MITNAAMKIATQIAAIPDRVVFISECAAVLTASLCASARYRSKNTVDYQRMRPANILRVEMAVLLALLGIPWAINHWGVLEAYIAMLLWVYPLIGCLEKPNDSPDQKDCASNVKRVSNPSAKDVSAGSLPFTAHQEKAEVIRERG